MAQSCSDRRVLADILLMSVLPKTVPKVANSHLDKIKWYECKICNKKFPSFQALGGHKSIHTNRYNKRKHGEATNIVAGKSDKRQKCLDLFTSEISQNKISPYKCDICRKTFPSYQVLEGHKSCHFFFNNNNITKSTRSNFQLFPESPRQTVSTLDVVDLELRL